MSYNLVVMQNFGEWLRTNRKKHGWTQEDLHKKSGVSSSYISTLERNQPHSVTGASLRPEPDKVKALAEALGEDEAEALRIAGYASLDQPSLREIDGEFAALFYESAEWSEENRAEAFDMAKLIFKRFKEKERLKRETEKDK